MEGIRFEFVDSKFMKSEKAFLPKCMTEGSAGYDFSTPVRFIVPPHGYSDLIFTNIKCHITSGFYLALYVRSSVGVKKNCVLANSVGVIDSDYYGNPDNDGNICFKLYNLSDKEVVFEEGERIIQGIITPYFKAENCNEYTKRLGGYGSTNEKIC